MKQDKDILIILFLLALPVGGGIVWFLILPEKLPLNAPPSSLFRRYVLDPIPPSVKEIRTNQTKALSGYGYTFRFKINKADLGRIINSRRFNKVTEVDYHEGILSCRWNPTLKDSTSGLTMYVYPPGIYKPNWFTLETWNNPEAYAIYEVKKYQRNMWVLVYNEHVGEAYFIVWRGHD
jgi:hypothetical protein